MIELILIFSQIIFLFFIFSFSIVQLFVKKKINYFDKISINVIFILNILLISSILNINDKLIFLLLIILSFLAFLKELKFKKNIIKDFNILLILFIFLTFIFSINLAGNLYFGWDAKFFYFLKTLNFYENQNIANLKKIPAFDYPHLGSYIWSFFWKYPFNLNEYFGRIFYVFIYLLSIFCLFNSLKIENFHKSILIILAILLSWSYEIFSGLQEIIVFSLIILTSKFSYEILLNNQNKRKIWNIIILLGITNLNFWIKNEGIFFSLFLIVLLMLLDKFTIKERLLIILGITFITCVRLLLFYQYNTELDSFHLNKTLFNLELETILEKSKIVLFYIPVYLTQVPIYFVSIPFLFLLILKNGVNKINLYMLLFFFFNFIFIFFSFLFTLENVEFQSRVGMQRILFETSGFYFLIIIHLLNKNNKKYD